MAGEDLRAAEEAAIGNGIEGLGLQYSLRLLGHIGKLRPIRAAVRYLVRHDQMMLGIDGDLHVVADDAGTAAARRHRTAIGIGQRDLLVGRSAHLPLVDGKLAHFLLQLCQLLLEPPHLRRQRFARLLVGRVKLAQIPLHFPPAGDAAVPPLPG